MKKNYKKKDKTQHYLKLIQKEAAGQERSIGEIEQLTLDKHNLTEQLQAVTKDLEAAKEVYNKLEKEFKTLYAKYQIIKAALREAKEINKKYYIERLCLGVLAGGIILMICYTKIL